MGSEQLAPADLAGKLENVGLTEHDGTIEAPLEAVVLQRAQDAVLLIRPSLKMLGDLLALAPEPASLAIVCIDEDLASCRELVAQSALLDRHQSVIVYHGALRDVLRDVPFRWQLAVIEGSGSTLPIRALRDLVDQLAAQGELLWHRADATALSAIARLISTGHARAHPTLASECMLAGPGTLPRMPATRRPANWSLTRAALIGQSLKEPTADCDIATLLQPFRQDWLMDGPFSPSGYGRWPYVRPVDAAVPETLPDGRPWPRISIVTPSYNQGLFIEETLLSVAQQGYPNVEHIVMDGGSTDGTTAIMERYRDLLTHAVSEPDRGQSHAINKGMRLATGEILTWLNSDDMLAPGALFSMALAFATSDADLVAGIVEIYRNGSLVREHITSCDDGPLPLNDLLDLDHGWNGSQFFYQPEVFFSRAIWDAAGGHVVEHLTYSMDYDLWRRFAEIGARLHVIGRPIALFRHHDDQKTNVANGFTEELKTLNAAYYEALGRAPEVSLRSPPDFTRRLRVAVINDHGWHWGAGIAQSRLAAALRRAGHDVVSIAFSEGELWSRSTVSVGTNELMTELGAANPDIILLGNLHGVKLDALVMTEVFKRWPSLIVTHDFWWLTGRCAYTGPCEKFLTGCDASCPTPDEYPSLPPEEISAAWSSKRLLFKLPNAPILLCQSAWAAEFAKAAFGEADRPKIDRISLGFDLNVLRPRDRAASRDLLGLPHDRFLILFSASSILDSRKGGEQVRSLVLNMRLPDVLFVSTGHGTAEQIGLPADKFRSLGYVETEDQMALIYSAVDLLVGPSTEETFGQVFAEAIACGTPVISHGLTGTADSIVDGLTGLVTRAATAAELEAAVLDLYHRPRTRRAMAFWGRVYAENEWSLEACGQRLYAALRRLGLIDRIGLPHKVAFSQEATGPGTAIDLQRRAATGWYALSGLSRREGPYPELGISQAFFWCFAPATRIGLGAAPIGRHILIIDCVNRWLIGLKITIAVNGSHLLEMTLPQTDEGTLVTVPVDLTGAEDQVIEIGYDRFQPAHGDEARPLVMMLRSLTLIPATG